MAKLDAADVREWQCDALRCGQAESEHQVPVLKFEHDLAAVGAQDAFEFAEAAP
ncbi:MAG: hypothetical protein HYV17_13635 [Xanthomonadales bacterium]|nr:hypothetical protein [Xanthomonadales bacterium]